MNVYFIVVQKKKMYYVLHKSWSISKKDQLLHYKKVGKCIFKYVMSKEVPETKSHA